MPLAVLFSGNVSIPGFVIEVGVIQILLDNTGRPGRVRH